MAEKKNAESKVPTQALEKGRDKVPAKQALQVQRVRGLRQYQKQQGHVVQPAKAKTQQETAEKALDDYFSKSSADASVEISQGKESARVWDKAATDKKSSERSSAETSKSIEQKTQSGRAGLEAAEAERVEPAKQSPDPNPKKQEQEQGKTIAARQKIEGLPDFKAPRPQGGKRAGMQAGEQAERPAERKPAERNQTEQEPAERNQAERRDTAKRKEKALEPLSPYQSFVAELSPQDMQYLLRESSSAIQVLLLKNASRRERSRILQQMPRKQRAEMLRDLAENLQKLDENDCSKAFHWLQRKVQQKHFPAAKIELAENGLAINEGEAEVVGDSGGMEGVAATAELHAEAGGVKALSMILDGLQPEQEEFIVASFQRDDDDLASWLERDRGTAQQRKFLRELCRQLKPLELAALFAEPKYGRLLRHLLNAEKMLEVLNASIDFARLSKEKRGDIAEEIYSNFPALLEY